MISNNQYYDFALEWILSELKKTSKRPLLLGLSAPQGTGKSTLTSKLVTELTQTCKINTVAVSIDDFYLRHEEQLKLSQAHPDNPFLKYRGYPGTHDLELMYSTLKSALTESTFSLPRYDKSLHHGKGDRAPKEQWQKITAPVDLILFEGWMLGFNPLANPPQELKLINDFLSSYQELNSLYDLFIHLHSGEPHYTFNWRAQAEEKRRNAGKGALSSEELQEFLELFQPAFKAYNPDLLERKNLKCPTLRMTLDQSRNVIKREVFD